MLTQNDTSQGMVLTIPQNFNVHNGTVKTVPYTTP